MPLQHRGGVCVQTDGQNHPLARGPWRGWQAIMETKLQKVLELGMGAEGDSEVLERHLL